MSEETPKYENPEQSNMDENQLTEADAPFQEAAGPEVEAALASAVADGPDFEEATRSDTTTFASAPTALHNILSEKQSVASLSTSLTEEESRILDNIKVETNSAGNAIRVSYWDEGVLVKTIWEPARVWSHN